MELYIVRHGTTDWNAQKRFQGAQDIDLNENGRKLAGELGKRLDSEGLDFDCTKIIIAQRISSTRNADKIIILDNGRIADIGTHDELIRREGYYKQIYDLQCGQTEGAVV